MPRRSYTTIVSAASMPRAVAAAEKAASEGTMCGSGRERSATPSMSKNWLPGMRAALNSSAPLRSARVQYVAGASNSVEVVTVQDLGVGCEESGGCLGD